MTGRGVEVMIDLTKDNDNSMDVNNQRLASMSHSRTSSDGYLPAVGQTPANSLPEKKSFSSYEIKSLSSLRITHTRLPDILQQDQKKNVFKASQPVIFIGWIQEHEESSAPLTITNDDPDDFERVPSADWAYTDGYVLDESLERSTRQVASNFVTPKGCNCDNDLGICDPKKCSCYALHEKLAPNPWVWQEKYDHNNESYQAQSEIQGDFAYKDGHLREGLVTWAGAPIWECNSNCSCSEDCTNRVVQKGRTVAFDLFKSETPYKGWGVRSKNSKGKIKRGTFITVYAGELLNWTVCEDRGVEYESTGTTYVLDIDSHHIKRGLYYEAYMDAMRYSANNMGNEMLTIDDAEKWAIKEWPDSKMSYSVDAGLWGNISRYFNHSCNPNMEMYPVYTEERDIRRPFLAFFAKRDIVDGEEFTFAYDSHTDEAINPFASNELESQVPAIKVEAAERLQSRGLGTEVTVKTSDRTQNLTTMKCGCGAENCRGAVFRRQI